MPYSIDFLLSGEAHDGRKTRQTPFVVHVETHDGFVELDADSVDHGQALADAWINQFGNRSAAIRRVFPDGSVGAIIGRIIS